MQTTIKSPQTHRYKYLILLFAAYTISFTIFFYLSFWIDQIFGSIKNGGVGGDRIQQRWLNCVLTMHDKIYKTHHRLWHAIGAVCALNRINNERVPHAPCNEGVDMENWANNTYNYQPRIFHAL